MTKLYSYIRWSSERQAKSTTLERQLSSAREYAREKGLELVEIIDPGVSAYRGKNSREGKLADFISAVTDGVIASDSWLYVENLDRITRQFPTKAQSLFINLLNLGLTVVTGMDKRVYTLQSVNENPMELMGSIMLFSRSHDESKTKSNRTKSNVALLVKRFKEDGLPVNIKSVGKHPWWIDDQGSQYEAVRKHEKYWPIAREIIDLFLSGQGAYKVKRYLDNTYPNGFVGGKEWDYQMLVRMRKSRALIGEHTITLNKQTKAKNKPDIWKEISTDKEVTYILRNYFPSLCSDEVEFIKLQEVKKQNAYQSQDNTGTVNIKLLSGLGILRCGKCGGTMNSFMNKGKPRYICTNGRHLQRNCSGWSVNGLLVDYCSIIALIIGYMDTNNKGGIDTSQIEKMIEVGNDKLATLDHSINNIAEAIEKGFNIDQMVTKGIALQQEREKLISHLDSLVKKKIALDGKGTFEMAMLDFLTLVQWEVIENTDHEVRNKIRNVINSIIETVFVNKTDGCISISIKLIGTDVYFVFSGDGRKPKWKFDISYGSVQDNEDESISTVMDTIKDTELMAKATEHLNNIRQSYLDLLDNVTNQMLPLLGYPDIDGKQFWPNTSGNERIAVNYNGQRYTLVAKGTLPADVALLIKESGLKRKDFIEKFRITN